jgi:hypothetical protein
MLPLVAYEQEIRILRARVEHVIAAMAPRTLRPLIGTMIELPRACFIADRIASEADFFSFGTNDLTQTALGSRATTSSPASLALPRAADPRPLAVRDDRRARRRLARPPRRLGRPGGEAVAQARHLRRARRRPGLDRVLPHGRP